MLVDTMIPEAFAETRDFAGLITVAGFLVSFALSKVLGGSRLIRGRRQAKL